MAKELPYFKFEPAEWLTGRISLESFETQAKFLNICCLYWQRLGDLKIKEAKLRLKDSYPVLIEAEMILESEDSISIKFLDIQLLDRKNVSEKAAKAGKISAQKRKAKAEQEFNNRSTTVQQNRIEEKREEEKKVNFLRENTVWRNDVLKHFNIELEEYLRHLTPFELQANMNRSEQELKKHFFNFLNNRDLIKKKKQPLRNWDDVARKLGKK